MDFRVGCGRFFKSSRSVVAYNSDVSYIAVFNSREIVQQKTSFTTFGKLVNVNRFAVDNFSSFRLC